MSANERKNEKKERRKRKEKKRKEKTRTVKAKPVTTPYIFKFDNVCVFVQKSSIAVFKILLRELLIFLL